MVASRVVVCGSHCQGRDLSAPIGAADDIPPVRAHRLSAPAALHRAMDVTTVDALIALIAERPEIWNKRNQSHSCRLAVEKCWNEISAALKVDGRYV